MEKKPPARGWQGSLKLDCVTEWFCRGVSFGVGRRGRGRTMGKKENSTMSPTLALMSLGTNVSEPLPTATDIVAACARAAEAAATRVVVKCMLRLEIFKRVLLDGQYEIVLLQKEAEGG